VLKNSIIEHCWQSDQQRKQEVKTFTTNPTINDYHYDNRGNLTQITENGLLKQSFTFDATGMMTQAFTQGKGMAEYSYNGFKKRVGMAESLNSLATATPTPHMPTASIQDPTSEVKYVLDMTRPYNNLLATRGTNQPTQSFVWGGSLLSAITNSDASNGANTSANASTSHYLQDHLGSPIRLLGDNNDNNPFAYDVFGEQITSPSAIQPFGFTGYQTDAVSGMHYAQARYYDPAIARFASEDTVRDGMNYYQYCYANPLRFVDLNGLWGKDIHEFITEEASENLRENLGINLDALLGEGFVAGLLYYNNAVDSFSSGLNFMPIIGNQGYHFDRLHQKGLDSRWVYAEAHLQFAINLALGYGNFGTHRLPYSWLLSSINNLSGVSLFPPIGVHQIYELHIGGHLHAAFGTGSMPILSSELAMQHPELRLEIVTMHLGAALHGIQDYHAHGLIDAGHLGIFGHAFHPLLYLIGLGVTPDSYNYEWIGDSRRLLRRTNAGQEYNTRILAAVSDSEMFLLRFIVGVIDGMRVLAANSISNQAALWPHLLFVCVE